jgi:hypothetical protein
MLFVIVFMCLFVFLFGSVFALLAAWITYRSRFNWWLACSSVVLGGLSSFLLLGLVMHMKALPAFLILAGASVVVGLLVGVRLPRFRRDSA